MKVNELSVSESLAVKSDNTGRPEVSSISCDASVGSAKVKFHGGARLEHPDVTMDVVLNVIRSALNIPLNTVLCYYSSWLYNLFSKYINRALKSALQKQVCDDHHMGQR